MSEAKRFLLVSWDGGGNVAPELAIARRLVARGHSVRVLADPTVEAEARAHGCEFSPWTHAPHRQSRDRRHDLIKDYEIQSPLRMMDTYLREFLAAPAPRWAEDTRAELSARPVDVVLADFALPVALIPAQQLGLATATLMPNIWIIPTPGIPPLGPGFLPARGVLGRLRDAVLRALTRRIFNRALPDFNRVRESYRLPRVRHVYEQFLSADQILVQTTPRFDFTSPHQPSHVRYVGPALEDPVWIGEPGAARAQPWQPPFAPDDQRPLVLVGLSSTFQNQVAVLQRVVAALSRLPVRGLVTLGPALAPEEVPGTSNVRVVRSAPHSQVLEHAALLVTHCGHGTTLKGLAAGVPLVCLPMGRDQNDTAARVVHAGAGVRVRPAAPVEDILAAIERVLAEPRFRAAALRLRQAISTHEGCSDAVTLLERLAASRRAAA